MIVAAQPIVVEASMGWTDVLSVVASAFALVLAIVAIWQAIVYFRMSNEAQRGAEDAVRKIENSTSRLEDLYSRLYSDLFSMTKETVADMRKQLFQPDLTHKIVANVELDDQAQARTAALKTEAWQQAAAVLEQVASDNELTNIKAELQSVVDRAVDSGRQVEREARGLELRDYIASTIAALHSREGSAVADEVIMVCSDRFAGSEVVAELNRMHGDGALLWNTPRLEPGSILHLTEPATPASLSSSDRAVAPPDRRELHV
jgi:hypothetical protein